MFRVSGSTLPEVQLRIENADQVCRGPLAPFGAPIPWSSSQANDVNPHSTADHRYR